MIASILNSGLIELRKLTKVMVDWCKINHTHGKSKYIAADNTDQNRYDRKEPSEYYGPPITVTPRVNMETAMLLKLILSPVKPAIPGRYRCKFETDYCYDGSHTSWRKITSIHFVPTILIMKENRQKSRPKTIKLDCAAKIIRQNRE